MTVKLFRKTVQNLDERCVRTNDDIGPPTIKEEWKSTDWWIWKKEKQQE